MQSASLDRFRCLNPACPAALQLGLGNIRHRKWYETRSGRRRLLRCTTCGQEFSELKSTALWNVKLPHERVEAVVEHVTRGKSFKETAELTQTHRTTVARLTRITGEHAARVHDQLAQDLQVTSLEADERHGFVGRKDQPCWEATVIDPRSKFIVQNALGTRTTDLAVRLLFSACSQLHDPYLYFGGYSGRVDRHRVCHADDLWVIKHRYDGSGCSLRGSRHFSARFTTKPSVAGLRCISKGCVAQHIEKASCRWPSGLLLGKPTQFSTSSPTALGPPLPCCACWPGRPTPCWVGSEPF